MDNEEPVEFKPIVSSEILLQKISQAEKEPEHKEEDLIQKGDDDEENVNSYFDPFTTVFTDEDGAVVNKDENALDDEKDDLQITADDLV